VASRESAPRVCIDSGVVIARVTGDHPQHADGIGGLWDDADSGRVQLFGSTWLLAEALGGRFSDPPDPEKEDLILRVLRDSESITLVQTSVQVAMIARDLRRQLHLKTADAVHLASAVYVGADAFMTTDERLPVGRNVMGVSVGFPESPHGTLILPSPTE
jgi:predicted nucleic acid-binding protein